MTGSLKTTDGPLKDSSFFLGQRTILGRAVDCDIQILARGVSRQHAAIIVNDEGEAYLMDLASKNGTFVDGFPILRVRLDDGMSFRISTGEFTFEGPVNLAATEVEPASTSTPLPAADGADDPEDQA